MVTYERTKDQKGKWLHRLESYNLNTLRGRCSNCGDVAVVIQGRKPSCAVGRAESAYKTQKGAHGLTQEQADNYKALIGECEVCGRDTFKNLRVDHNHITGQRRGVLCARCNLVLHAFEDATLYENLMQYLKYWNEKEPNG